MQMEKFLVLLKEPNYIECINKNTCKKRLRCMGGKKSQFGKMTVTSKERSWHLQKKKKKKGKQKKPPMSSKKRFDP